MAVVFEKPHQRKGLEHITIPLELYFLRRAIEKARFEEAARIGAQSKTVEVSKAASDALAEKRHWSGVSRIQREFHLPEGRNHARRKFMLMAAEEIIASIDRMEHEVQAASAHGSRAALEKAATMLLTKDRFTDVIALRIPQSSQFQRWAWERIDEWWNEKEKKGQAVASSASSS